MGRERKEKDREREKYRKIYVVCDCHELLIKLISFIIRSETLELALYELNIDI